MMKRFGLIGKTLVYSFSSKYFADKFEKEKIEGCQYDLFELANISEFPSLIKELGPDFAGLNVTIPYKKEVMAFLDTLDDNAAAIDAVNTIKLMPDGSLRGYNTDYAGFRNALEKWDIVECQALILGTGGASNAVRKALEDKEISYQMVSRTSGKDELSYSEIEENPEILSKHTLIVNTTPLGTFPNEEEKPSLPYHVMTKSHMLFDLVYNPEVTSFMKEGLSKGARVQNGYDMLVGQAEASWRIWNS